MKSKLNYQKTCFLISAAKLSQCPDTDREVAFAGRSNAGKSSALNALTNINRLARTSKTPGRTQLINFFEVEDKLCLVDLPGYGYAKVSISVKEAWGRHLSDYLRNRKPLKGLVLLMDIRHPLKEFDQSMLRWASDQSLPVHILLTKADKLKYGAAKNALSSVRQRLTTFDSVKSNHESLITIQLFSSLKRRGVDELAAKLDSLLLDQADEFATFCD